VRLNKRSDYINSDTPFLHEQCTSYYALVRYAEFTDYLKVVSKDLTKN
jgi:hypothetical protein